MRPIKTEYWFETNSHGLFEFYSFQQYDHSFYTMRDVPENYSGCCLLSEESKICWFEKGLLHRINDPAMLDAGGWYGYSDFYILGHQIDEDSYPNHPAMIEYKLQKILNL